jgi:D-glycerate 3-kinase
MSFPQGDAIADFMRREKIGPAFARAVQRAWHPLGVRIQALAREEKGLVVGICGSQGSGKSTGAAVLQILLREAGLAVATLSIDDLYLSRAERSRLAETVHPLLATRGPPGTHDVALGVHLLEALGKPGTTAIPRFDKARDARADPEHWDRFEGPADVILFEGWCVGARPEPPESLAEPVNDLERNEDPDGSWRRYVNAALAGPYRALFDPIAFQVFLAAPSFDVVAGWRKEQEEKLRRKSDGGKAMSDAEIDRFVQFYERLTRFMLAEMPDRSDALMRLSPKREILEFDIRVA